MSEYLHRNHNVTVLIYHTGFPAEYPSAGHRIACVVAQGSGKHLGQVHVRGNSVESREQPRYRKSKNKRDIVGDSTYVV